MKKILIATSSLLVALAMVVFMGFGAWPAWATAPAETDQTDKPYTVTMRLPTEAESEEVVVGHFDVFDHCLSAMDINDSEHLYTIYVNRDTVVPAKELIQERGHNKMRITSAAGGPYTLKMEDRSTFFHLVRDAELTIDHIIIDGDQTSSFTYVNEDAKLILDDGAVIQNFNYDTDHGYSALVIYKGELLVKEGAEFKNNTGDAEHTVIYVYPDGKVNIEGGTFSENISQYFGGVIMTFGGEINITGGTFVDNGAKTGGGVICAYGGTVNIANAIFDNNVAGENGGVIMVSGENTTANIDNATLKNNQARAGGAIFAKNNAQVSLSNTLLAGNIAQGVAGGAIFTAPYEYADPITAPDAYQNLTIDQNTVFTQNKAATGISIPPANYADFTNLQFKENSFSHLDNVLAKSLLNNYDINYINPESYIVYDANGGTFADGKTTLIEQYDPDDKGNVTLSNTRPTRKGYRFNGWKNADGTIYQAGDQMNLTETTTLLAQWKKRGSSGGSSSVHPPVKPNPEEPSMELNSEDHDQYLVGVTHTAFKPNNNIKREEVAVMFYRLLRDQPHDTLPENSKFSDVTTDRWSAPAIQYLSKKEMLKGYPDGTFQPQAPITRAEFTALATRFFNLTAKEVTFSDVTANHWASDAIEKAATAGWIGGYPDGTFRPNQPITRAESVSLVNRMLNRYADQSFVDENTTEITPFADVSQHHWAYYAIAEATNGHDYARKNNGKDETWQNLNHQSFVK